MVNLHVDGMIQVSTGATEMGQGVNTKISQVVSNAFGINVNDIKVMTTSTEKNHNTSPTAASSGSDINCAAALKASNKIIKKIKCVAFHFFNDVPFDDLHEYEFDESLDVGQIYLENGKVILKEKEAILKEVSFKKICEVAYLNRIFLGQYAFYKTENIGFDKKKGIGTPFNYFTNGVAATEVEIDRLTGEMKILRTDILMDLGRPINPGIDIGQVTGGFIQGMGWVTQEALFTDETGTLKTHSPTTYKIPNIQDTPRIFNVNFIENNENKQAVVRSKAVGEPPFLLGISCYTAILNAINNLNLGKEITMSSPATNEKILMAISQ